MRGGRIDLARRFLVLATFTSFAGVSAEGQMQDAFLPGGEPPGTTPTVFAPGLVASAAHEYGLTVDQDWSEIYFTRSSGEQSVIMTIRREGESWSSATPASFSGQHIDAHPWLAPGGRRLYFVSRRPCPGARRPHD